MPLRVTCPSCGKVFQAPDSAAGKRAMCGKCGQVMMIPGSGRRSAGPAPAGPSRAPAAGEPTGGPQPPSGPQDKIGVACPGCGKVLYAPATAAGKKAQCPACRQVMLVPPLVQDAEEVFDQPPGPSPPGPFTTGGPVPTTSGAPTPFGPGAGQAQVSSGGGPPDLSDLLDEEYPIESQPPVSSHLSAPADDRRPCPVCGEMIAAKAVKCRYCGEVFDEALRTSELVGGRGAAGRKELRKFRRDMNLLGGLWAVLGVLATVVALVLGYGILEDVNVPESAWLIVIIVVVAIAVLFYIIPGMLICAKRTGAVYVVLVFSYLSLARNVQRLFVGDLRGIFGSVIALAFLFLAHRCLNTAGRLRRAGIPLDTDV